MIDRMTRSIAWISTAAQLQEARAESVSLSVQLLNLRRYNLRELKHIFRYMSDTVD